VRNTYRIFSYKIYDWERECLGVQGRDERIILNTGYEDLMGCIWLMFNGMLCEHGNHTLVP
jgi:hypothetical protein